MCVKTGAQGFCYFIFSDCVFVNTSLCQLRVWGRVGFSNRSTIVPSHAHRLQAVFGVFLQGRRDGKGLHCEDAKHSGKEAPQSPDAADDDDDDEDNE